MSLDPRMPVADVDRFAHEIREIREAISALTNPTGTEAYQTVKKLQALVDDIQTQLDDYIANGTYNKAQIDAKIASPGAIAPTSVTSGGIGQFNAGVRSVGAYGELLTGGGAYVAAWIHVDGRFGYVPSSRRFKTNFEPIVLTIERVLELQGFYFQYLAAAPYSQEAQRVMMGLLAEDTHDAGFTWLVDYDEDGKPYGIRGDMLAVVVLEGMRDFYGRFLDLAARVDILEGKPSTDDEGI